MLVKPKNLEKEVKVNTIYKELNLAKLVMKATIKYMI